MERFAIGVDFGGTKISAGVVNLDTGQLVAAAKKKTRLLQEQEDIIKKLQLVVDDALAEANMDKEQISGIGIGVAGMVNRSRGVLLTAANIGVSDIALAEPINDHYGIPCRISNDVEAATRAEITFGAGRACESLVCIFIGTGIGSCIVNDGQIRLGATETAGELGHTVIVPEGKECGCGGYGCLEAYASRTAIAKVILSQVQRGVDSVVRDKIDLSKGILRSKAISHAIQAGDELVIGSVTSAARYLALGLTNVVNFYNPQRLVLGGGLVEASELYFSVAEKETRRRALTIPSRKIEIVKAELGDYAGIIGAALLMK
jgi:glucokinase